MLWVVVSWRLVPRVAGGVVHVAGTLRVARALGRRHPARVNALGEHQRKCGLQAGDAAPRGEGVFLTAGLELRGARRVVRRHVFHPAREHEPNQRAALLQQACAGDEVLRQEVNCTPRIFALSFTFLHECD